MAKHYVIRARNRYEYVAPYGSESKVTGLLPLAAKFDSVAEANSAANGWARNLINYTVIVPVDGE